MLNSITSEDDLSLVLLYVKSLKDYKYNFLLYFIKSPDYHQVHLFSRMITHTLSRASVLKMKAHVRNRLIVNILRILNLEHGAGIITE